MIAFIGSVFSPYYAAARRRGPANPYRHCALNLALYGTPARWAMTERGAGDIALAPDRFAIGPSSLAWQDGSLVISVNERSTPDLQRLRGEIRVERPTLIDHEVVLDSLGRHRWRPLAPRARIRVTLDRPALSWTGTGYLDSNQGDEPLESGFSTWSWSRASLGHDTLVLYDAARRDGSHLRLARIFGPDGIRDVLAPPEASLRRGLWGVARPTRADAGTTPALLRRYEDAPFYTRSEIRASLLGREAHGVHESLDLDRFAKRWVQVLLPFRMPRIARK